MNAIARSVLAAMLLLAGVSSAGAQEGLGTVVCVGSELESMASAGAVRRVISKDVQLGRAGAGRCFPRRLLEQQTLRDMESRRDSDDQVE